jgi:maltooligosyltrehalose trehalohydrolase
MPSVWAPAARKVELLLNDGPSAMERADDGWWHSSLDLAPGEDYRFRIDGEAFPDPRSGWQPQGVHGPSRHIDHASFAWTDENWQAAPLSAALMYELHIGTFTEEGTFDATIGRLDSLKDLGVTHVEIMPVAAFLGDHGWGYDGVYPYAPHHTYGGPDGFKRLINACHAKGLAVILDVVYNHLGPSGNYLPRFGPYFADRHSTPWGAALNFDGPHSDEVRRFFCDNALMWLRDYHLDGLRLDAVHAIVDTSAYPFLEQLADEVKELEAQLGRRLVLVAESDLNDPRIVRAPELSGYGLNAQWSDDFHHALHTVLTGELNGYYEDFGGLGLLATALTRPFIYAGDYSPHRRRRHGRLPANLPAHRFLAFMQNHDQIGNRAQGDRISHVVGDDRTKIGAALVLLSPYVPLLFQGEEWAASSPFQYFVSFRAEPDLAGAVANGRAKEFAAFGWPPEQIPNPNDFATFRRSKLNWGERNGPRHASMLRWYRALIQLRRRLAKFMTSQLDRINVAYSEEADWLLVQRGLVCVVCNFASEPRSIALPEDAVPSLLLASKDTLKLDETEITLPAEAVAILGPELDVPA